MATTEDIRAALLRIETTMRERFGEGVFSAVAFPPGMLRFAYGHLLISLDAGEQDLAVADERHVCFAGDHVGDLFKSVESTASTASPAAELDRVAGKVLDFEALLK